MPDQCERLIVQPLAQRVEMQMRQQPRRPVATARRQRDIRQRVHRRQRIEVSSPLGIAAGKALLGTRQHLDPVHRATGLAQARHAARHGGGIVRVAGGGDEADSGSVHGLLLSYGRQKVTIFVQVTSQRGGTCQTLTVPYVTMLLVEAMCGLPVIAGSHLKFYATRRTEPFVSRGQQGRTRTAPALTRGHDKRRNTPQPPRPMEQRQCMQADATQKPLAVNRQQHGVCSGPIQIDQGPSQLLRITWIA